MGTWNARKNFQRGTRAPHLIYGPPTAATRRGSTAQRSTQATRMTRNTGRPSWSWGLYAHSHLSQTLPKWITLGLTDTRVGIPRVATAELLLQAGNGEPRVETLRARLRAVHNGVTPVHFERIIEILKALSGKLITGVSHPTERLPRNNSLTISTSGDIKL